MSEQKTMTLAQAAYKWKLSHNWVRELITSGRIPAKLMEVPIKHYVIPANCPKPLSMQRAPARKGTTTKVKPESIARRAYRAKQARNAAPKTTQKKVTKKA